VKLLGLGSRRAKVGLSVAGALVIYFVITWALGKWLELTGWDLWILRGALWVLGLIAGGIVLWFAARGGGDEQGEASDDDIDAAMAAARARLAASRTAKAAAPGKLPLVVVLGPAGTAKTASVLHCGLDPDLLAGEVSQGDRIPPTRAVNLWYTNNTVVVEAGGGLLKEPSRWARFVHHLVPDRLRATLTGRAQARRVAVVCFSCEDLLKTGGAAAVPAAAQDLRARLVELGRAFGIPLPVYVLFTKADRIPHFAEFAHHLSRDEVQLGLGATLRWPARGPAGLHAEREFQRVNEAFQRLFTGLAASRLQLLPRENDAERRAAVYEFPRELRKIVPLAAQFLVDLCRPSQLAVSPVLRGFYFTGVRAVVTSDAAPAAPSAEAAGGARGATQVFDARLHQASPRDIGAPATARKVPQWLFLGGVFRDVILRDRAGDAMAQGGVHVNLWRRGLLGTVAGMSLLWLLGMPVSCLNNRRLAARTLDAAQGLQGVFATEADVPSPETLNNLDRLRQGIETLADYERQGPPLRLRWGLYEGSALYRQLGKVYESGLEAVLLRATRASLVRALGSVPDAPRGAGDYARAYDLLKAYLMTTTEAKRIEPAFLDSMLMDRWIEGRQIDSARLALAHRQFDFYARKFCPVYPCGADNDGAMVSRARNFLLTYAGPEQIYQAIITEASARNPPVSFARQYSTAAAVLMDAYDVPGAFTPGGWAFMRGALANPDQFFQAENWVLGAQARVSLDRPTLLARLRAMYDSDYVRRWANYLASARLVPFGGAGDAARKLAQLSGNESPLLQLFRLAAQNTNVDSQAIGIYLQPVHAVTPPTITDKFVSDANKPYMDALIGLQTVVAQAAGGAPGGAEALAGQALEKAQAARGAVAQLSQKFQVVGAAAEIGGTVRRLMEEPVARVEQLLGSLPAQAANQRAVAFCTMYQALRSKYPINPNGTGEATLPEVAAVFHPQTGALAGLKSALTGVLVQQGTRYLPVPGGAIRPSAGFVDFFNRAAGVSDALWQAGPNEPRFTFSLRPTLSDAVPVVTVTVDGQVWQFTRTQLAARPFDWVGARAREVRVTAQIRGREEILFNYGGTWAVFKLFNDATWRSMAPTPLGGVPYILQWQVPRQGITLEMELNLGQAPPFLRKDFFPGMGCVSRVQ
jgi:type VI secretion system protein ImpL